MYLTGSTNDRDEPFLAAAGVGLMVQPGSGYARRIDRYDYWAADNACYANKWDERRWIDWLAALPRDRCLFAVAPDVYPDAVATLRRSSEWFDIVRDLGFPVALVAQDHAEKLSLPWDDFDVLFLGGERKKPARLEWKVGPGAERVAKEARQHGKWVHMGRVNSLKRMQRARMMGCNSADGTFVKYRRRHREGEASDARDGRGAIELDQWVTWLRDHPMLFTFETPALLVHREANRAA